MRVKAFFEIRCNVFSDSRGDREKDHYNEHLTISWHHYRKY
jgi:hypothetical protein